MERKKNEQIKGLISNIWLFFFVTQYDSSLSSFVPNCRALSQVVAEKSLTEKKFTYKQTNRQTNKHNYRKGKNYIPPIKFVPGGGGYNYRKGKNYIPLIYFVPGGAIIREKAKTIYPLYTSYRRGGGGIITNLCTLETPKSSGEPGEMAHNDLMLLRYGQLSKNNLLKIGIIFLSISVIMCFGYSKEASHQDGSFEYPQHMFWLKNKKNNFQVRTLIWRPGSYQIIYEDSI